MTLTIKDSLETNTPGKQGSASQNSQGKAGESPRRNPVCLEVMINIRSLPNETGGLSKPIREEVKTVIVFDNGAVIRCAENLPVGYTVILSNSTGREVVCRVVGGQNMARIKGYVEIQFVEPVNDFWSTYQGAGAAVPMTAPASHFTLQETISPSRAPASSPDLTLPAVPSNSTPMPLDAASSPDEVGGLPTAPLFAAPRDSKANTQRRGPGLAASAASSYSHSENAKPSTIGGWNPSVSETGGENHAIPAMRESSSANSSSSSPGASRDFMSKSLMAYDKPPSSASAQNGRMPTIVGAALLAVAGVAGVIFFLHRNANPAPATMSANINQPSAMQPAAPVIAPDPSSTPPESASSVTMSAQPAAQPISVEQSKSVAPAAAPAVLTSPVNTDSRSDAPSARKPEKNSTAAKPSEPLVAPRPAITNLKMSSPSAPAKKTDLGAGAAPITEIAASEAAGGTPSAGLLTSSGRISNPPAPPPPAPAPMVASKMASAPRLISSARLAYPQAARQANVQGTVMVFANIDVTGKVVSANALSGPLLLREAAVNAVKEWKYSPGTLDGKPAPSQVTIGVEFKLH